MPLTKEDTLHFKGVAILGMVMLHLFCRRDNLPYQALIWIGDIPLIYYFGLFGDICVPIYCFCSGYAHFLLRKHRGSAYIRSIPSKALRFMLNFWIVVTLFSVIGLFVDASGPIPGSFLTYLGNMTTIHITYNGAWWFANIYLFLLLLSPVFYYLIVKIPNCFLLIISGCVYFVAYVFSIKIDLQFSNVLLQWVWEHLMQLGTSQFMYFVGMATCNGNWPDRITKKLSTYSDVWRKYLIVGLPLSAFVGHGIVQSLFVAPLTATTVLLSVYLMKMPTWLSKTLTFLGTHSTNIWLIHMFFYLTLFKGFVFQARYPLLIVVLMFTVCICCSYLINLVYRPICKRIS